MIRLSVLGTMELKGADGGEILSVLAQPKRFALLVYLALAGPGRYHRRDTLLGLFWPESDQARARDSLRQAVRYLRRSLGEEVITGRGGEELGLSPSLFSCDAAEFQEAIHAGHYGRALELYRGDLLPSFFVPDAPEFEAWLAVERTRLGTRAAEAACLYAAEREGRGDRSGAAAAARRALEVRPTDEGTLRALVALLDRIGDRAAGLRAYEEFATRLRAECDAEPSPETMELVAEIRRSSPEPTPAAAVPRAGDEEPRLATQAQTHQAVAAAAGAGVARRRRSLHIAFALLLGVLGAGVLTSIRGPEGERATHVIVGPFTNRTGEPSYDPVGELAADRITRGLSRIGTLVVLHHGGPEHSRGSALTTFPPTPLAPSPQRLIVRGNYYRSGDSIQFEVRVDDAAGMVVSSLEPIGGTVSDIQSVVQTLGTRVAGTVAARIDPLIRALTPEGVQPPTYEAYLAWAEGLELFSRWDYHAARERLLRAASLDSNFVSPLIWATAASGNAGEYERAGSLARLADQRRDRLLPFDRHFLDLWLAILRSDHPAEHRAARSMLQEEPSSELALYLVGNAALKMNRPNEAVDVLRRMQPGRSVIDWDAYGTRLPEAYHMLGRYGLELETALGARARRPELLRPYRDELRALAALGRSADVIRLLDRIIALPPQPQITPAAVAMEAADELRVHGHHAAAAQAVDRAVVWYSSRPAEEKATRAHRYGLARALARLGRFSEAERILRELLEERPRTVDYLGTLGVVLSLAGDSTEAEHVSAALERIGDARGRGKDMLWRARIAVAAGKKGDAIALIRAALAQGQMHRLTLHADPDFEILAEEPGFLALVRPRANR